MPSAIMTDEVTDRVSQELLECVDSARPRLVTIDEHQASDKPYPDKWSLKELLGHLIDSASNNHQRIVRMQEKKDIGVFGYEQLHWVKSQAYQSESWETIVQTWYYYNKHLAHIIRHIHPACLENICDIDYPKPATLRYVVEDYLRHLQHHLDQIFSDADPRERTKWKEIQ